MRNNQNIESMKAKARSMNTGHIENYIKKVRSQGMIGEREFQKTIVDPLGELAHTSQKKYVDHLRKETVSPILDILEDELNYRNDMYCDEGDIAEEIF